MERSLLLIALVISACEREPHGSAAATRPAATDTLLESAAPKSKPPSVVPMPKDQSELDRMILAGYTPHGNHLHPPGMKECPLAQGSEAVM